MIYECKSYRKKVKKKKSLKKENQKTKKKTACQAVFVVVVVVVFFLCVKKMTLLNTYNLRTCRFSAIDREICYYLYIDVNNLPQNSYAYFIVTIESYEEISLEKLLQAAQISLLMLLHYITHIYQCKHIHRSKIIFFSSVGNPRWIPLAYPGPFHKKCTENVTRGPFSGKPITNEGTLHCDPPFRRFTTSKPKSCCQLITSYCKIKKK